MIESVRLFRQVIREVLQGTTIVLCRLMRRHLASLTGSFCVFFLLGSFAVASPDAGGASEVVSLAAGTVVVLAFLLIGHLSVIEYFLWRGYEPNYDHRKLRAFINRFAIFSASFLLYTLLVFVSTMMLVLVIYPVFYLVLDRAGLLATAGMVGGLDKLTLYCAIAALIPFFCLVARVSIFLCAVVLNEFLGIRHYRQKSEGLGFVVLVSIAAVQALDGYVQALYTDSLSFGNLVIAAAQVLLTVSGFVVLCEYYRKSGSKLGLVIKDIQKTNDRSMIVDDRPVGSEPPSSD